MMNAIIRNKIDLSLTCICMSRTAPQDTLPS